MSACRLASDKKGPRNLSLKFGPNWATLTAEISTFLGGWVAGGWVAGGGWVVGEIGIKAISTSIDLN